MYKKFLSLSLLLCLTSTFNSSIFAMEGKEGAGIAATNSAQGKYSQEQLDVVVRYIRADAENSEDIKVVRELSNLLDVIYGKDSDKSQIQNAIEKLAAIFKEQGRPEDIKSMIEEDFKKLGRDVTDQGSRLEGENQVPDSKPKPGTQEESDTEEEEESGSGTKSEDKPGSGSTNDMFISPEQQAENDLDAIISYLNGDKVESGIGHLTKIQNPEILKLSVAVFDTEYTDENLSKREAAISELAKRLRAKKDCENVDFENIIHEKLEPSKGRISNLFNHKGDGKKTVDHKSTKEGHATKIKKALENNNNGLKIGASFGAAAAVYAASDGLSKLASGTYNGLRKVAVGTKNAVVTSAIYLKDKAVDLKNGNLSKKEVAVGVAGTAAVVYGVSRRQSIAGLYNSATMLLKGKLFGAAKKHATSSSIKSEDKAFKAVKLAGKFRKFFTGTALNRDYTNTYKALIGFGAVYAIYKLAQKYRAKKQEAPAVRLLVSFEDNNCDSAGNPCEMSQDLVMLQTKIAAAISCRDVNALRTIMDEYRDMLTMEQLADCEATISDMQEVA